MSTTHQESPRTAMPCGCVFETPPEAQTVWNRYITVCPGHAGFPDFDAFKEALKTEQDPASQETIRRFNDRFRDELRASYDSIGNRIPIRGALFLTTTGAKSGRRRTTPVTYVREGADFVIIGSAGGRAQNPSWYHNVLANPAVEIELANRTLPGVARAVTGDERQHFIDYSQRVRPIYVEFWERAHSSIPREIPIVVVRPDDTDLPFDDAPI